MIEILPNVVLDHVIDLYICILLMISAYEIAPIQWIHVHTDLSDTIKL